MKIRHGLNNESRRHTFSCGPPQASSRCQQLPERDTRTAVSLGSEWLVRLADGPTVQFIVQVTAPAGPPDPRGGSFAPSGSVKAIVTPQKSAAGGNADDPSRQRRKRMRARNSALGTMLATAKRRENAAGAGKRSDEGRVTLTSALGKPSAVAGAPNKGNADTRGAPKVSLLFEKNRYKESGTASLKKSESGEFSRCHSVRIMTARYHTAADVL